MLTGLCAYLKCFCVFASVCPNVPMSNVTTPLAVGPLRSEYSTSICHHPSQHHLFLSSSCLLPVNLFHDLCQRPVFSKRVSDPFAVSRCDFAYPGSFFYDRFVYFMFSPVDFSPFFSMPTLRKPSVLLCPLSDGQCL